MTTYTKEEDVRILKYELAQTHQKAIKMLVNSMAGERYLTKVEKDEALDGLRSFNETLDLIYLAMGEDR